MIELKLNKADIVFRRNTTNKGIVIKLKIEDVVSRLYMENDAIV